MSDRQLTGSSQTVMVVSEVSPPSQSRSRSRVVSVEVVRDSECEDWGFSLSGGWGRGQWLAVASVNLSHDSPALLAGLQAGDALVQVEGQLVIFLDLQQVELLVQRAGTKLSLTVER